MGLSAGISYSFDLFFVPPPFRQHIERITTIRVTHSITYNYVLIPTCMRSSGNFPKAKLKIFVQETIDLTKYFIDVFQDFIYTYI